MLVAIERFGVRRGVSARRCFATSLILVWAAWIAAVTPWSTRQYDYAAVLLAAYVLFALWVLWIAFVADPRTRALRWDSTHAYFGERTYRLESLTLIGVPWLTSLSAVTWPGGVPMLVSFHVFADVLGARKSFADAIAEAKRAAEAAPPRGGSGRA